MMFCFKHVVESFVILKPCKKNCNCWLQLLMNLVVLFFSYLYHGTPFLHILFLFIWQMLSGKIHFSRNFFYCFIHNELTITFKNNLRLKRAYAMSNELL